MFEGVYDSQNVAIIANALARCEFRDEKLMNHLALVVQQVRNLVQRCHAFIMIWASNALFSTRACTRKPMFSTHRSNTRIFRHNLDTFDGPFRADTRMFCNEMGCADASRLV